MKAEPPILSREQLHEAKFLEDQLQNLINLATTQENQSPADRQKMEQLFRNYRRLHNKLMEAARRLEETDPLIEILELRRKTILTQMQQRASASPQLPTSDTTIAPAERKSPRQKRPPTQARQRKRNPLSRLGRLRFSATIWARWGAPALSAQALKLHCCSKFWRDWAFP